MDTPNKPSHQRASEGARSQAQVKPTAMTVQLVDTSHRIENLLSHGFRNLKQPAEAELEKARTRQPSVSLGMNALVSYSHKDERYMRELEIAASQLRRNGLISVWHDRKILPGEEWDRQIDLYLSSADLVLLLVSPDFLASEYAYSREMSLAMEQRESGMTIVIPIILRASDWTNSPLSSLQVLPSNARPVLSWTNRDEAWLDVVQGLRRLSSRRG
jgi:TIR domain